MVVAGVAMPRVAVARMIACRMVGIGMIPGRMVMTCVVVIGMALPAVLLAMRIVLTTWMIHGRTLFMMIAFRRRGANSAPRP